MLASDYLPVVWQPDPLTIALRRLVAYYSSIVTQRTSAKNRVHAVLQRNLVPYPLIHLFRTKGRKFLSSVSLPSDEMEQVTEEFSLLDALNARITTIKKRMARLTFKDDTVKRLMTITGVGLITACTLRSAIGNDISRFPSSKKLVSYFGLGCSVSQSADRCYVGRITKRGNIFARSALVQAAQVIVKYPSPLRAFFQRLNAKKGRNKSIIAVASKLTRIIWHMLTNCEDYRYDTPFRTRMKLSSLNFIATGAKRKPGSRVPIKGKSNGRRAEREYRTMVRKRMRT